MASRDGPMNTFSNLGYWVIIQKCNSCKVEEVIPSIQKFQDIQELVMFHYTKIFCDTSKMPKISFENSELNGGHTADITVAWHEFANLQSYKFKKCIFSS